MPTGKNAHKENAQREICPQGKMPTRKNAHFDVTFICAKVLLVRFRAFFFKSEFECNMECTSY